MELEVKIYVQDGFVRVWFRLKFNGTVNLFCDEILSE